TDGRLVEGPLVEIDDRLVEGPLVETDGRLVVRPPVETDGSVVETDGSVVEIEGPVVETGGRLAGEPEAGVLLLVYRRRHRVSDPRRPRVAARRHSAHRGRGLMLAGWRNHDRPWNRRRRLDDRDLLRRRLAPRGWFRRGAGRLDVLLRDAADYR